MRKGVDLAGGAGPRQERGEDILAAERDRTAGEGDEPEQLVVRYPIASVRRKMHLSLIFLEFLSEMDLEVLGLPSKISAERAVFARSERGIFEGVPDANRL